MKLSGADALNLRKLSESLEYPAEALAAAAVKGVAAVDPVIIKDLVNDLMKTRDPVATAVTQAISGYWSFYNAFEKVILEKLDCVRHYRLMDLETDFENGTVELTYNRLSFSTLLVDVFTISMSGLNGPVRLEAGHYLGDDVPQHELGRFTGVVKRLRGSRKHLKRNARLDGDMLLLSFMADTLDELPTIPEISDDIAGLTVLH